MTNIMVARYPIGKVETMVKENKHLNVEKKVSNLIKFLDETQLTRVVSKIDARQEELHDLGVRCNCIEALTAFFNCGGTIIVNGYSADCFDIDEDVKNHDDIMAVYLT